MVSTGIPAGEEVKVIVVVVVDRIKYTARVVEDQDGDWQIDALQPAVTGPLRTRVEEAVRDAADDEAADPDEWDEWDDYDVDGDL